jgi:hypothetical protein
MRRNFPITLIVYLILCAGCKKSMPGYMATGSIIGADPRVPACGGGTWIQVVGHPNPNNPFTGYFDMGTVPAGFRIPDSAVYPIKVELDYTINTNCPIYIDISRIKIID